MEFLRQGYRKLKASAPTIFQAKAAAPNPIANLNPYKMLLIGETGSGKTSFLNLICNFNLVQALGFQAGLEQFHNFNDFVLENAASQQMESKTSDAKLYNVEFHDLKVGIIDTPGFGDSRGMDEDEKHVKRIIDALKDVDCINCVCLIINGRNSRCTATLQYVLTEITAVLPKTILDNVMVVFTNTADALDLNFAPTELTKYFGREIKTYFCIENPYCKFEKARKLMGKLQLNMIAESLKKGFEDTGRVLNKMYSTMKPFTEVHTFHFINLYKTKQEIEEKVRRLLIAYDNQLANEAAIKKTQKEIQEAAETKTLNENFKTEHYVKKWKTVKTDYYNTLCGAAQCHSNCHRHCALPYSMGKERFRWCGGVWGSTCRTCGHSYIDHFHEYAENREVTEAEDFLDETAKGKYEAAKSMEEKAELLLAELNAKQKESEKQRRLLSEQLLLVMEEFHQLGLTNNYARVLESQIHVVKQRVQVPDVSSDEKDILRNTLTKLEKKLQLVNETLKKPWSKQADEKTQKAWAYKMLNINEEDDDRGPASIEQAYKDALAYHTGDDETIKRIKRAYEILS